MALKLRKILRETPDYLWMGAQRLTLEEYVKSESDNGNIRYQLLSHNNPGNPDSGREYPQRMSEIILNGKDLEKYGDPGKCRVRVYCNCDFFFMFGVGYVMWINGACSRPQNILDIPPKVRNPQLDPFVCKHLIALGCLITSGRIA